MRSLHSRTQHRGQGVLKRMMAGLESLLNRLKVRRGFSLPARLLVAAFHARWRQLGNMRWDLNPKGAQNPLGQVGYLVLPAVEEVEAMWMRKFKFRLLKKYERELLRVRPRDPACGTLTGAP